MALLPDELSSGDIVLRRWHPDMVDAMVAAVTASLVELRQWMPWAQSAPTHEEMLSVIENGSTLFDEDREWNYVLFERSSDDVVGAAGLHVERDPACPEIGYWVRSDRTGRGYATSAARILADAAFLSLPYVEQVKIRMDTANFASAAVPPKVGFRLLREEDRPIQTPGHTGRGYLWVLDRATPPT